MKPTRNDLILIAVILTIAILFGVAMLFLRPTGDDLVAELELDGTVVATLPLDTPTTLDLPTGHTVTVADGAVSVTSAPCRDQICAHYPPAHRLSDTIVCLPESFIITIKEAAHD